MNNRVCEPFRRIIRCFYATLSEQVSWTLAVSDKFITSRTRSVFKWNFELSVYLTGPKKKKKKIKGEAGTLLVLVRGTEISM